MRNRYEMFLRCTGSPFSVERMVESEEYNNMGVTPSTLRRTTAQQTLSSKDDLSRNRTHDRRTCVSYKGYELVELRVIIFPRLNQGGVFFVFLYRSLKDVPSPEATPSGRSEGEYFAMIPARREAYPAGIGGGWVPTLRLTVIAKYAWVDAEYSPPSRGPSTRLRADSMMTKLGFGTILFNS